MIFRYIMIPVLVLTGCSFSNPFLSQFSDKGTLELLPVYTTDIDILSNTVSMVMLKDYVVWDRCHAMRGTVLHTYHIPGKILSQYKNVDGAHLLYKLNDSMVTSIQLARKCRMDILIRDTIKEVATYSFRIRNKDSFNWLDDYYFVSVYPTDETATYFFGQTTTKKTRYGVYEQSHQAFYPSTSCYPPTEKEMTLLSPDYWNDAFIIKQKNRNRFAVFRKYYQLFDLIDVDRFTIKPVKRISIPHTLLTFQDQLNLERQLVFYFFPGLDVFSKNALAASDSVIIPVEAHILSSDGLDQVERMIRSVQRHLNKKLKIEGVVITKYQGNTNYCKQISELVARDFGDHIHIFDHYIKYAIKVAEAPVFGISLHEYAPTIDAAKAYASIAREVMQCG